MSEYLRRHVARLKSFIKPEGIEWYEDKLKTDPDFRRKERRRHTYRSRYQTDGSFWLRERNRSELYAKSEAGRESSRRRCREYRKRLKAKRESWVERMQILAESLQAFHALCLNA